MSSLSAVEHAEIQTIDVDWEPQEDIGSADNWLTCTTTKGTSFIVERIDFA
jgi:hypothetical protein